MSQGWGLAKYLKNYKKESIVGPLFKMLEASFELIVPILMARLIDMGVRQNETAIIWKTGVLMIGMGLLGFVCSITAQYFAAKAAMGFGAELRSALFRHIGRLSYPEIDRIGSSTLITRVTADVDRAQAGVNLLLRILLRAPFIVIGSIVMALLIDKPLTLIFLAATPLISLVIYFVISKSLPGYKRVQAYLDRLSLFARENLRGVRVIRAFSRQKDEYNRFRGEAEKMATMQIAVGRIAAVNNPLTYAVVNLSIAAILWYGGYRVDGGAITQGQLIALVNYMTQILLALMALANLIVVFSKALASGARIEDLMAVQPSIVDGAGPDPIKPEAPARVEFDRVSFGYAGGRDALYDVSFQALPGQMIGVIGGTGSGKSTMVGMISRFYDASSGRILIDGADIRSFPLDELRKRVGVVPQTAVLFSGTIRDNMRWAKSDATDEEILTALKIAQAEEFVSSMPLGLDAHLEQGGTNLSGGQRQRLTIARALAGKPEILILDDSASALDYATDAKLRRALRAETKRMTVFIVSQRASSIRSADLILVMDNGRLVGKGTHDELMAESDIYREICASQQLNEEAAK